MFEQLAAAQELLETSRLLTPYRRVINVFDRRGGSVAVAIVVKARNNGSVSAELQAAWDGNSFDTVLDSGSFTTGTNGAIYLRPVNTIPAKLRIVATPAGDFDGNIEVWLRSAGIVSRLDPLF